MVFYAFGSSHKKQIFRTYIYSFLLVKLSNTYKNCQYIYIYPHTRNLNMNDAEKVFKHF